MRVREGECLLEAAGESHSALRGQQLSRAADGTLTRHEIEPYDAAWEWVVDTAPRILIDGRPLAQVLTEVGRELGREVRYADTEVETLARDSILSGPPEGFAPRVVLDTVLHSDGLRHQVENGSILISR